MVHEINIKNREKERRKKGESKGWMEIRKGNYRSRVREERVYEHI